MERKVTSAIKTATVALGAMSAAGAGFLAAGIKSAIDAQDEFAKLAKQTGLAVDTLAGLKFAADQSGTSIERVSKATRNFSALVVDAANGSTEAASKIKSLGLNVDELLKLNPEERFLRMAGALEKFGAEDQAVALTRVLGDRMAELVPLLSGGEDGLRAMMEEGKRLNPVTAESAAQAEKFNDSLDSLKHEATQFVQVITVNLLPALSSIVSDMREAARTGGALDVVMAGLSSTFREVFGKKATSDIAGVRVEIFKVEERIRELQAKRNSSLGFLVPQQDIELEKVKLGELNKQLNQLIKTKQELQKQPASPNTPKSSLLFDEPKAQLETRVKQTRQLVSEQERLAKALQEEGKRLTEQIDPLARKNSEIERYKTLLESGAISEGIYTQAVERSTQDYLKALGFVAKETEVIEDNTRQLGNTTRDVFDSMEQIAIQGVRNIQSSFADGIFNFFDRGLKGMVDSVVTAVGRMASEFASIKLLQAAGGLFGLGGASTAFASGGVGLGTGLSLASLGTSAVNLFKTGLGATGLIGGGLSALGGSSALGMFGAGMQGGSAGAAFIAAESATGAGAAGLGASMGAVAGPLIALAVADQIGRLLAGNKSTGTFVDKIPVIGGFAGALFGRGPFKFREQQILGNVSAGGFEGEFADVFRSKGGLLVGNKHKRQGVENEDALQELFDTAIKGFADSTRAFADTLGIDADSIDDYTKKIFIRSEKGQRFTEEKIGEILAGISDDFATGLIPTIDELSITGESASQTLQRLSTEFDLLRDAAILFGDSAEIASEKVKSLGLGGQSDFIAQFGGSEKLAAELSEFYNTAFTESQKLEVVKTRILDVLKPIGIDFIPTLEQLYDAVRSGNPELINAAFQIDALVSDFNQLSAAVGASGEAIKDTADAFKENTDAERKLMQSLADERRSFTSGRRDVQEGRSAGPIIATTIGGRKVTESEIRAMQKAEIDSAAESATALFKEQLSRTSDPQLIKNLNATLEFIKFQSGQKDVAETASRLTDDELTRQAAAQLRSLNDAERAMRNTTFNGSVQFPFPPGTNESADAADKARLAQFDIIKSMIADPAIKVSSAFSDLSEAALDLANDLLLGDKSILSVFQKTSEAQRQYNDVITRARSGSATSSELSRGVNNLLDAQINSASTKFEFDRQFAMVVNDLRGIGQTAEDRRAEEQKKSTAELKAEIKQLRDDLNAANVAITKNTAQTADVLNRWSIVGLPATEV